MIYDQLKNLGKTALLAVSIVMAASCDEETAEAVSTGAYVVALRTQGASGTSDYLLVQDTINNESATITATGRGVEQLGWCYFASVGKTIFSFSYGMNNKSVAYELNANGQLTEKGSFAFERIDCIGQTGDKTIIGIGAPWGGGSYDCEIQLIDADFVGITARKKTPIYRMSENDTLNKWPTDIAVQNDKMYVSFYPLHGTTWATPLTDTAYVAVYSYPALEPITILKDARTGPIGYYGSQSSLIADNNGDIYTISPNSLAAGYTQSTKKSGILRIKKGATGFDPDYYFDVETASGGAKLLTATYAGNGKLVGRVVKPGADTTMWNAFDVSIPICKLVVIDLNAKTVTDVSNVPDHGGEYRTHGFVENGKVYMSITSSTEGETRVYEIDPATATGKKAAKIEGIEAPAIFKLN